MQIDAENLEGGVLKLSLAGRMDARGTSDIDAQFAAYAATQQFVVVEMSAVNFLSSIGIRTLVQSASALSRRGGKMVVLNPDANATRILKMAGIDLLIKVVRTLDEARRAFAD